MVRIFLGACDGFRRAMVMGAVVLQAIEDICAVHYRDQRAAIKWIFCNSEDFRMVCELAGVAPRWVRQKAFEKIIIGR